MTRQWKRAVFQVFAALLFVFLGVLGMKGLIAGKPEMKVEKPAVPPLGVQVVTVKTESSTVIVKGEGTVRPLSEINFVPQVSGKVIEVSESLVNGGRFSKGDVLLRIDPVDYELAVTLAEAKVKDAESRLELAREEATVALEEWNELHSPNGSKKETPPPLVIKEPQLKAAAAKLEAERADLKKAELNLERTQLKAPFNGIVSQENVDVGQYVVAGQPLAAMFSTDAVEIVVPLEDRDLSWFQIPGFTPAVNEGSAARVRAQLAGREWTWPGRVVRTEGERDERTRMTHVLIRVDRPYDRKPPLGVGLFVQTEIDGIVVPGAVSLPRSVLQEEDRVWVVDEERILRFRQVTTARIDGETVLITEGLKDGERVVVSRHAAVTDGMRVRVLDEQGRSAS